jgi:hypothetical protein
MKRLLFISLSLLAVSGPSSAFAQAISETLILDSAVTGGAANKLGNIDRGALENVEKSLDATQEDATRRQPAAADSGTPPPDSEARPLNNDSVSPEIGR